jgi:hypothetical protein
MAEKNISKIIIFKESIVKDLVVIVPFDYSQTCLQRPPLGPQKSGRCSKVKA